MMLISAAVFFGLAILNGIHAAWMHLADRPIPMQYGVMHGGISVMAFALIVAGMVRETSSLQLQLGVGMLMLTAVLGLTMLSRRLRGGKLPPWLIATHAAIGLSGFVLVLIHLFVAGIRPESLPG